jgi:ketosteroid isomerase-like protein
MCSFDPMATAIDWLDAYRAADLNQLVDLYADDAALGKRCFQAAVFSACAGR